MIQNANALACHPVVECIVIRGTVHLKYSGK